MLEVAARSMWCSPGVLIGGADPVTELLVTLSRRNVSALASLAEALGLTMHTSRAMEGCSFPIH